jgi:transcriptional regulator with XRE-family HTH domain
MSQEKFSLEQVRRVFPVRLREAREANNLQQHELVKLAKTSRPALCRMEGLSGTNYLPSLSVLVDLAITLNTSIDYLLGFSDVKAPLARTSNVVELPALPDWLMNVLEPLSNFDQAGIDVLLDMVRGFQTRRHKRPREAAAAVGPGASSREAGSPRPWRPNSRGRKPRSYKTKGPAF